MTSSATTCGGSSCVREPSLFEPFIVRLEHLGLPYFVTGSDELHQWALAHRRSVTLDGLNISVAPVEYVILRKLEYFREGKSEKHVRDIREMLEVSPEEVDRPFLEQWITRLGLTAEWRRILEES
jgi:hypothetical protein